MSKTVLSPTMSEFGKVALTSAPFFQSAWRTIFLHVNKAATASLCFAANSRSAFSLTILRFSMLPKWQQIVKKKGFGLPN
jgi:hypothetical protein